MGLKSYIYNQNISIKADFMPLPYFPNYKDFDFESISSKINVANPDLFDKLRRSEAGVFYK